VACNKAACPVDFLVKQVHTPAESALTAFI